MAERKDYKKRREKVSRGPGRPRLEIDSQKVFECGQNYYTLQETADECGCSVSTILNNFHNDWLRGKSRTRRAAKKLYISRVKTDPARAFEFLRKHDDEWGDKPVEVHTENLNSDAMRDQFRNMPPMEVAAICDKMSARIKQRMSNDETE